jgi:hypothetical protein
MCCDDSKRKVDDRHPQLLLKEASALARPLAIEIGPPGGGRLHAVGALVLLVGAVGLVVAVLYWSPWAQPRRWSRRYPPIDEHPGGPGY